MIKKTFSKSSSNKTSSNKSSSRSISNKSSSLAKKPTSNTKTSSKSSAKPAAKFTKINIVAGKRVYPKKSKATADKIGKSFKSKSLPGLIKVVENDMRLNKAISDSGLVSRRKADELILSGVVKVNGKIIIELGTKVKQSDSITVKGDPIPEFSRLDYIILNKPKNYICTTSDEKNRRTIFDIVHSNERVFPIGRLDRNTTGVILITNDGELTNRLTHPSYTIEKTYNVKLDKDITIDVANKIIEGVQLEDGLTGEAFIEIDSKDKKKLNITITEGKNREIRRIFEHFKYDVLSLNRKVFAGLTVKGLSRGEYRRLTKIEISYLKKLVDIKY